MDYKGILDYNPDTGIFTWKSVKKNRMVFNWQEAGSLTFDGYRVIVINGKKHRAHRIAYELVNGPIPDGLWVDHINHIRDDNRICNLRLVTKSGNMRNATLRQDNSSGVTGVSWHSGSRKWRARINHNGKSVFLGFFSSLEEAARARKSAEKNSGYHANHGEENERYKGV